MSKPSNLVIVESPSKAKTIGKYLGPDYIVKASMGHLRDLPKSKMGVDLEQNFEPQYIPVRGKEDLIKELKKDAAAVGTVYLAVSTAQNTSVSLFRFDGDRPAIRSAAADTAFSLLLRQLNENQPTE